MLWDTLRSDAFDQSRGICTFFFLAPVAVFVFLFLVLWVCRPSLSFYYQPKQCIFIRSNPSKPFKTIHLHVEFAMILLIIDINKDLNQAQKPTGFWKTSWHGTVVSCLEGLGERGFPWGMGGSILNISTGLKSHIKKSCCSLHLLDICNVRVWNLSLLSTADMQVMASHSFCLENAYHQLIKCWKLTFQSTSFPHQKNHSKGRSNMPRSKQLLPVTKNRWTFPEDASNPRSQLSGFVNLSLCVDHFLFVVLKE